MKKDEENATQFTLKNTWDTPEIDMCIHLVCLHQNIKAFKTPCISIPPKDTDLSIRQLSAKSGTAETSSLAH